MRFSVLIALCRLKTEGFAVPTSEYAVIRLHDPLLRQGILFNSATPLKCLYSRMRDGLSLGSHNHPYRPRDWPPVRRNWPDSLISWTRH